MSFAEAFLREPTRLPAADPEIAWGSGTLTLALPGGPVRLSGLAAGQRLAIERRFAAWQAPSSDAIAEVRVLRIDGRRFRAIDTRGWEYALDLDFAAQQVRLAGRGLVAEIELGEPRAHRLWTAAADPAAAAGDVENLLRVLCAYRLLDGGAVMVHAAAVAADGWAAVAAGRSGAGKSTFARLARAAGATLLSDDLVALRLDEREVWVDALPFGGDLETTGPVAGRPLAALLRLEQASAGSPDRLLALGEAEMVAHLLSCTPVVNRDPFRREALLALLPAMVARMPRRALRRLRFRRHGGSWPLVRGWVDARVAAGRR